MLKAGMRVTSAVARKRKGISGSESDKASIASQANTAAQPSVVFSGKVCVLCKESEEQRDHVMPSQSLKWGYGLDEKTRHNCGDVCHYCPKVYRARFRGKYKNYNALAQLFGNDLVVLQCFKYWRSMCIRLMRANGSWEIYIKWGAEEAVRQLIVHFIKEVRLEDPEDEIYAWLSVSSKRLLRPGRQSGVFGGIGASRRYHSFPSDRPVCRNLDLTSYGPARVQLRAFQLPANM